jgi:hypothetical protein
MILKTLEKVIVFGFYLKVEVEEECFISIPIFLCKNIWFSLYMCFNKGSVGWVIECRDWFKDMMIGSKGWGFESNPYGKVWGC